MFSLCLVTPSGLRTPEFLFTLHPRGTQLERGSPRCFLHKSNCFLRSEGTQRPQWGPCEAHQRRHLMKCSPHKDRTIIVVPTPQKRRIREVC